jgi:Cu(I)/Ag(I) efflux system protein CusF
MKGKIFGALVLAALALATAACSPPSTSTTAPASAVSESKTGDMAMSTTAQATGPIRSNGVVTQVDASAGTITFNHQAIPAINWPAMTMQFHAENPSMLQGIAVGDHVTFELKSATETGIVTMVQKQ